MCVLQSERLNLRPPRPWDIQDMAVWLGDFDVARMLARVPHPYTEDDAEMFLAMPPDGRHMFVVERRADGRFLGMIGLDPGREGYEIGFWLGKPYWGAGYASEAAGRMLHYAFTHLGLDSVRASRFIDNPAAGRLLAKLGARHAGSTMRFSRARGGEVPCHAMRLTKSQFLSKTAA